MMNAEAAGGSGENRASLLGLSALSPENRCQGMGRKTESLRDEVCLPSFHMLVLGVHSASPPSLPWLCPALEASLSFLHQHGHLCIHYSARKYQVPPTQSVQGHRVGSCQTEFIFQPCQQQSNSPRNCCFLVFKWG